MTTPKVKVRPVAPGEDVAAYLNELTDHELMRAFIEFYLSARDLPPADSELVELVRIRNGVAQSCEYCLSIRLDGGVGFDESMARTVVQFEDSELPDRQKAALRLAAAYLDAPWALTQAARDEALAHLSPDEIIGLLLKLTSFLVNKQRAALGIDGRKDADGLTHIDAGRAYTYLDRPE